MDWSAIKAEYIAGDISQRKIAEKYGVSFNTLKDRANSEKWADQRAEQRNRATTVALQKAVDAAADNATLAQEIKRKLLLRLKRTEANFPLDATEVKRKEGKAYVTYKLKDLTAAYKDLTADIEPDESDALKNAKALLEGVDSAID